MNESLTRTNLYPVGYPPDFTQKKGYTSAVRSGQTIWVSGQVAFNQHGEVIGMGDIEAQIVHILEKIKSILANGGASMDDVVKTTIYLTDASFREPFQRIRRRYFREPNFPAAVMVVITALVHPELLVEVEAIAVVGSAQPAVT